MTTPPLDLPADRLAALRDIANAATPGPWHALELPDVIGNCTSTIHAPNAMDVPTWSDIAPEIAGALKCEDATHIAAFDPPTVQAMIDSLSEESARADRAAKAVHDQSAIIERLTTRAEAAERDLAAVTVSRDGWQPRAKAAEKKVAAVEAAIADIDATIADAPPANYEEDNYDAGYVHGLVEARDILTPETETTP